MMATISNQQSTINKNIFKKSFFKCLCECECLFVNKTLKDYKWFDWSLHESQVKRIVERKFLEIWLARFYNWWRTLLRKRKIDEIRRVSQNTAFISHLDVDNQYSYHSLEMFPVPVSVLSLSFTLSRLCPYLSPCFLRWFVIYKENTIFLKEIDVLHYKLVAVALCIIYTIRDFTTSRQT